MEGFGAVAGMFGDNPDYLVVSDDEVLSNMKKDLEKNKLCESKKIKLIRIREPELPILNSTSIDFRISTLTHDHSYMNDVLRKLLEYLKVEKIDVDVERDFNEIYSLYQKGEKKESIINEYPDLIKEWDYQKNQFKVIKFIKNVLPIYKITKLSI